MLNIENLEAQPQWRKVLRKNILNNRQLDFTGNMFLSCITEDSEVDCEMLNLKEVTKGHQLVFPIDARNDFFSKVKSAKKTCVNVYFPLSKEKMKFYGKLDVLNIESEGDSAGFVAAIWEEKLGKEEKKMFRNAKPDTKVLEKDDLNTFNSPDVANIPKNFVLFVVNCYKVEHTVYTLPQVIADHRTPQFETLFKPYKTAKKFIHKVGEDGEWGIEGVNPW